MPDDTSPDHAEPVAVASFATIGEAEVAQAKLSAFGIESALIDQVEGGVVPVEGEPGVFVGVRADDAVDARLILSDTGDTGDTADSALDAPPPSD
jgi:hypothetical protein